MPGPASSPLESPPRRFLLGLPPARLSPQPHGFEGLGPVGIGLEAGDLPVADRIDDGGRELDLLRAALQATGGALKQKYPLPTVDCLLDLRSVLRVRSQPVQPGLPEAIQAGVSPPAGQAGADGLGLRVHERGDASANCAHISSSPIS